MSESERAAAEEVPLDDVATVNDDPVVDEAMRKLHESAAAAQEVREGASYAHPPVDLRDESGTTLASLSRVPVNGTSNTASAGHAAKVSAAKGLVEVRRRTGRPIPDDVRRLAEQG